MFRHQCMQGTRLNFKNFSQETTLFKFKFLCPPASFWVNYFYPSPWTCHTLRNLVVCKVSASVLVGFKSPFLCVYRHETQAHRHCYSDWLPILVSLLAPAPAPAQSQLTNSLLLIFTYEDFTSSFGRLCVYICVCICIHMHTYTHTSRYLYQKGLHIS